MATGDQLGGSLAQRLLSAAPVVTLIIDREWVIRRCDGPVEAMTGYRAEEVVGTEILHHIDTTWNPLALATVVSTMESHGLQRPMLFRLRRKDGSTFIAEATANAQMDDPLVRGVIAYFRRWDERHQLDLIIEAVVSDTDLEEVFELLCGVFGTENLAGEGCVIFDGDDGPFSRVVASPGLPAALAVDDPAVEAPWRRAVADGVPLCQPVEEVPEPYRAAARAAGYTWCWAWPVRSVGGAGACLALWRAPDEEPDLTCRLLLGSLARVAELVLQRHADAERLRHAATHDALTGLANRALFFERLGQALAAGSPDASVGVLYVDLDRFKPVNDELGHAVGDRLLAVLARRLEGAVRQGDLVARLGGDEFAVACPDVGDPSSLGAVARRVVEALSEPVAVGGRVIQVGASVGVAVAPVGAPADDLMERADRALYAVKETGRGGWRVADLQAVRAVPPPDAATG